MAYVVGSAEVELVPTAQGFDAKANAAIGDLRVGVELVPDILGLKAKLEEVGDLRVGVELDAAVATAEVAALTADKDMHIIPDVVGGIVNADLDILTRPRKVEIDADVHPLDAKLAEVKAIISGLKTKMKWDPDIPELKAQLKIAQAAMGELKVHVGVDSSDYLKVAAELKALKGFKPGGPEVPVGGAGGGEGFGASLLSSLPLILGVVALVAAAIPAAAGVTGLLTALIPIAAVAVGDTLALGALFGVAAGGIGLFVALALAANSTSTAFQKSLAPALHDLQTAFGSFLDANRGDLLAPVKAALHLLESLLPALTPILHAASVGLSAFLQPIQAAVDSGVFAAWTAQIAPMIGPAMAGFGAVLTNVAKALGEMIPALAPLGTIVLDGLVKLSAGLVQLGQSKGFHDFLSYVIQNIPAVSNMINGLVGMVGSIIEAMAPLGASVLNGFGKLMASLSNIGESKGFKEFLAYVVKSVPPTLDLIRALMKVVGDILTALAPVGSVLLTLLTPVVAIVGTLFQVLAPVFGLIGALLQPLLPLFVALSPLLQVLVAPLTLIAQVLAAILVPVLQVIVTVLVAVIQWLTDAINWVIRLAEGNKTATRQLQEAWHNVQTFFLGVGKFFLGIWSDFVKGASHMVIEVGTWFQKLPGRILSLLAGAGRWLLKAGVDLLNGLATGIIIGAVLLWDLLVKWPTQFITWLTGMVPIFLANGLNFLISMAAGIVQGAETVWAWFQALPGVILSFLVAAGVWLVQTGLDLLTGMGKGIIQGAEAVWNWFTALPGVILSFVLGSAVWLVRTGLDLLDGMNRGIVAGWNAVRDWFIALPGVIYGLFASAGHWLLDTGAQIVNGLWTGIRNAWDGFMGWLRDRINSIPKAVRDVLGIHSPSRVMAEIGGFMGLGLQEGLSRSIGTAMDSARAQIRSRVDGLGATATAAIAATVDATALGGSSAATNDYLQQILAAIRTLLDKTATADEIARANRILGRTGMA